LNKNEEVKNNSETEWDPYKDWPKEKLGHPFFPHHMVVQLIQFLLVFALLIVLSTLIPAPMEPKADPFTTPEHIKPEWYFLAAYQFLKVAEKLSFLGKWAPKLVGVLGQGLGILLLFSVPFIDRSPERNPSKRKFAILAGICGAIIFIAFTIWGKYS
jgi:ubiquinol-cytochrome c reductase cytochrome b subunit